MSDKADSGKISRKQTTVNQLAKLGDKNEQQNTFAKQTKRRKRARGGARGVGLGIKLNHHDQALDRPVQSIQCLMQMKYHSTPTKPLTFVSSVSQLLSFGCFGSAEIQVSRPVPCLTCTNQVRQQLFGFTSETEIADGPNMHKPMLNVFRVFRYSPSHISGKLVQTINHLYNSLVTATFIFSLQQISSLFSCTIASHLSSILIHGAPWPRIHSGLRQALHCGKQEGKMKGAKVEPHVESEKAKLDVESDNSKRTMIGSDQYRRIRLLDQCHLIHEEKAKLDVESDNSKAKETWSPLNDALVSQISDLTRLESTSGLISHQRIVRGQTVFAGDVGVKGKA
ncbi:hypothetical protein C8J56DRAFT_1102882 [Mycena floridula]|nr:hypothetical protein C8J56DRAFT_1102882 [Mycena floridula]